MTVKINWYIYYVLTFIVKKEKQVIFESKSILQPAYFVK